MAVSFGSRSACRHPASDPRCVKEEFFLAGSFSGICCIEAEKSLIWPLAKTSHRPVQVPKTERKIGFDRESWTVLPPCSCPSEGIQDASPASVSELSRYWLYHRLPRGRPCLTISTTTGSSLARRTAAKPSFPFSRIHTSFGCNASTKYG